MSATWRKTTMGDAFEMYQPRTLSQAEIDSNGSYKVYGANGVIGRHTEFNHEDSQVLITCRGATCGTINISEPKSWINGNAMVIKPRSNDIDKNFLKHYLLGGVDLSKCITGAAQPQITRQSLNPIQISIPPLAEQRRIAEQLDTADRILRLREASIAKLDQLAQSIFVEMFGDPILNEKKYPIKSLQEVCLDKGQYGANVSASEWDPSLPRYIRITDVMDDGSLIDEAVAPSGSEDEWQDYFLRKGDLLFARSGATVGKTYIHRDDSFNAVFAGYMIRFSPNLRLVEPDYLFAFTRTAFYKTWVKSRQNVVAQPNINAKQYGNELLLPIPPLEHQRKFCLFSDSIHQQKLNYLKSAQEQMLLFSSLQHQSFSVN